MSARKRDFEHNDQDSSREPKRARGENESAQDQSTDTAPAGIKSRVLKSAQADNAEPKKREVETDPQKIAQREKQISFGKNTIGYDNYTKTIPKNKRERGNPQHPTTPNPRRKCSKRAFDGLVKAWRRALHKWDPANANSAKDTDDQQIVADDDLLDDLDALTPAPESASLVEPEVNLSLYDAFEDDQLQS
eukprot:c27593_g1_i1.p1 GENE.c27593_g1_i1~~c27593_g1_i1.p1  ORF type:complete len:215 (+),score=67.60 c27593_g1_i1:73-645(+)